MFGSEKSDGLWSIRTLLRRLPALRAAAHWLLARSPTLRALVQRGLGARADTAYRAWIARHDTLAPADRAAIARRIAVLPPVRISVVMPVYNSREAWLRAAIASVRAQLWPHWQLCIADDASTAPHVARVLAEAARDPRVRVVRRPRNGHISAASNAALALAEGDFVALMDHDDLLPEQALYRIAEELAAHPEADLLYSDEDQLDHRGRRCQPHFKTDWDAELMLARNVISHLGVYRRSLLAAVGGLREGFEGSQDHDLALRIAERTIPARIRHIPAVLYHWRQAGAGSFSERRLDACAAASRRAVIDHLANTGAAATVHPHPRLPHAARVLRPVPDPPPLVSVLIPTRDRADLLGRCVSGLLTRTDYRPIELVIVDNASTEPAACALLARLAADPRVRVLRDDAPFNFAAMTNRAATAARGSVLLLLNNDIAVIEPGWLAELAAHAIRPEIGAVGAKLLYPDGRVQHAGIVLGLGPARVAGHPDALAPRAALGVAGRLQMAHEVSAVTAACMALRREAFLAVGGLDAADLPVAFNDVDLCLRLRARGWRILWTPFAELCHAESASRGPDDTPARAAGFARAVAVMRARWGAALDDDPFYNPNFSLDQPYRLAAPRREPPWRGPVTPPSPFPLPGPDAGAASPAVAGRT